MPQAVRTYTNKDLNQPMSVDPNSTTPVYRNSDLKSDLPPDIMDNPSDVMDSVALPPDILDEDSNKSLPTEVPENAPDTFAKGVMNSLTSGEALNAGMQGLKGFAKGAVLDLPSSIMGGLTSIGNLITNPRETINNMPSDIANMASNAWETTKQAGAHPEEFGRMMGQVTGQPLVTAGLTKGIPEGTFGSTMRIPSGVNIAGSIVKPLGTVMRKYQPLSGVIPRMVEPRILRTMEKGMGRGIENIGNRMKSAGKSSVKQGEITPDSMPNIQEGEIVTPTQKALPPSNTSFYGDTKNPNPPIITPDPGIRSQLPPSKVFQYGNPSPPNISKIGTSMDAPITNVTEVPPALESIANAVVENKGGQIKKFTLKNPTPEALTEVQKKGFVFDGMTKEGGFKFVPKPTNLKPRVGRAPNKLRPGTF